MEQTKDFQNVITSYAHGKKIHTNNIKANESVSYDMGNFHAAADHAATAPSLTSVIYELETPSGIKTMEYIKKEDKKWHLVAKDLWNHKIEKANEILKIYQSGKDCLIDRDPEKKIVKISFFAPQNLPVNQSNDLQGNIQEKIQHIFNRRKNRLKWPTNAEMLARENYLNDLAKNQINLDTKYQWFIQNIGLAWNNFIDAHEDILVENNISDTHILALFWEIYKLSSEKQRKELLKYRKEFSTEIEKFFQKQRNNALKNLIKNRDLDRERAALKRIAEKNKIKNISQNKIEENHDDQKYDDYGSSEEYDNSLKNHTVSFNLDFSNNNISSEKSLPIISVGKWVIPVNIWENIVEATGKWEKQQPLAIEFHENIQNNSDVEAIIIDEGIDKGFYGKIEDAEWYEIEDANKTKNTVPVEDKMGGKIFGTMDIIGTIARILGQSAKEKISETGNNAKKSFQNIFPTKNIDSVASKIKNYWKSSYNSLKSKMGKVFSKIGLKKENLHASHPGKIFKNIKYSMLDIDGKIAFLWNEQIVPLRLMLSGHDNGTGKALSPERYQEISHQIEEFIILRKNLMIQKRSDEIQKAKQLLENHNNGKWKSLSYANYQWILATIKRMESELKDLQEK